MQSINITVAVVSFVLHFFMWQAAYSIAAATTTLQPQKERKYTQTQKKLLEFGWQPPGEAQQRTGSVHTQPKRGPTLEEPVHMGVIGLLSGGVNGTDIQVVVDLVSVLDKVETLRVLSIIGKGSAQNITDLFLLQGVDISIVQSDVLSYLERESAHRGLNRQIHYITKLYNQALHLLAAKETATIQDLAGKKVNFGIAGSGTHMTASTIFGNLAIGVEPTFFDQSLALEKLKQGEIAGMVYVVGKPAQLFQNIGAEGRFHFVPVPTPAALLDIYRASQLTAEEYPRLISQGHRVTTVAVSVVLAVFNWRPNSPRYRNVTRFVDAFFPRFAEFQKLSRYKQWAEGNRTAPVPGWTRFKAAADWLTQKKKTQEAELKTRLMQFLSEQNR